jgi:hypothetical protein
MSMEEGDTRAKAKEIRLFEEKGPTSRFIYAKIEDNGDVVVSGQDVGEAPRKFFNDGDYEFWVTVKEEHKDQLILVLIEKLWKGKFKAVEEFREFLKEKGIPSEWMTWS